MSHRRSRLKPHTPPTLPTPLELTAQPTKRPENYSSLIRGLYDDAWKRVHYDTFVEPTVPAPTPLAKRLYREHQRYALRLEQIVKNLKTEGFQITYGNKLVAIHDTSDQRNKHVAKQQARKTVVTQLCTQARVDTLGLAPTDARPILQRLATLLSKV